MRRFHSFIQELVRGEWLRFVLGLRANRPILASPRTSTSSSSDRSAPPSSRTPRSCVGFSREPASTARAVSGPTRVRWTTSSRGHATPSIWLTNFVLAHAGCNDSKSNLLASVEHLERWCIRNVDRERVLADAFAERRLAHDLAASRAIMRWAYGSRNRADPRSGARGVRGRLSWTRAGGR